MKSAGPGNASPLEALFRLNHSPALPASGARVMVAREAEFLFHAFSLVSNVHKHCVEFLTNALVAVWQMRSRFEELSDFGMQVMHRFAANEAKGHPE
jgi:hypothetical protein